MPQRSFFGAMGARGNAGGTRASGAAVRDAGPEPATPRGGGILGALWRMTGGSGASKGAREPKAGRARLGDEENAGDSANRLSPPTVAQARLLVRHNTPLIWPNMCPSMQAHA